MARQVPQRVFDGKVYFLFDWCFNRKEANIEAKQLRCSKEKWFVRVIPAGTGYNIWRR